MDDMFVKKRLPGAGSFFFLISFFEIEILSSLYAIKFLLDTKQLIRRMPESQKDYNNGKDGENTVQ